MFEEATFVTEVHVCIDNRRLIVALDQTGRTTIAVPFYRSNPGLNSSFIAIDETPASIVNNVFCHTRSRIQIAKKRSNSRAQSDPRDARNINEDKSLTSHTVADSE